MGVELTGNLTFLNQPQLYTGQATVAPITYNPEGIILILFIVGIALMYFAFGWNLFENWKKKRRAKE